MATAHFLGERPPRGAGRDRGSGPVATPLVAAGLCLLALALTWVVAALVPATHFKDAVALRDFTLLGGPRLHEAARMLLHVLDPLPYCLWGVGLVALALKRRRPWAALAVGLVLALAPLTAEMLKPLLAHPHARVDALRIGAASWPSGHSTAALALVLCGLLLAPERMRKTVAWLGALFVAAVSCSLLLLAWHMPSDVLGGYLVAALWMALALAGLRALESRPRGRSGRGGGAGAGVGAVSAGVP